MLHIVHKINLCASAAAAAACWKALSHFVYFLSLSLSRCVSASCYVSGSLLYSANVSLIAIAVLFTWQCLWCRDPVWRNLQYENVHSLLDRCVFFQLSCVGFLVVFHCMFFPLHCHSVDTRKINPNNPEPTLTLSLSLSLYLLFLFLCTVPMCDKIIYFFTQLPAGVMFI